MREIIFSLVGTVIAAAVGYLVWWLQTRSTNRRIEALKTVSDEKERLAKGHKELIERVTVSETALTALTNQLALMEQQARPLFEAAKIRLIASLTHPDEVFAVPDELLKLTLGPNGYVTPELEKLLKEREKSNHPDVSPEEKLAAAILPKVVELAALEAKVVGPLSSQIVSSPAATPNEPEKK